MTDLSNRVQKNCPLSSVQREIWFEQTLYPDTPVYNIGGYGRISGPLDPQVFRQALALLVRENDILRLTLVEGGELPYQSFPEMPLVDLDYCDCSQELDPRQTALAAMQLNMQRPFRLSGEPLFRYSLYKLSNGLHLWSHTYHHLVADGHAVSLITQRVAALYNALLRGEALPVNPGVPYRDFVEDDAAYLDSPAFERHRNYWRQAFSSPPPQLFSRRAGYAGRPDAVPGAVHSWFLPRTRYARLEAVARELSVSPFHVLLGLLYVYFTRVREQEECVIGLPVLNRTSPGFRQTIGLFAGVVPVRFSHGRETDFAGVVRAISRTVRESYRNQRFPVSEINRLAGVFQSGRQRLFDLSLSFEKHDYAVSFDACAPVQVTVLNHGFEQTPLAVFVRDYSADLDIQVDFSYNLAYFEADDMVLLQKRFMALLEDALAHPGTPVSRLNLLPPEERRQLAEWQGTAALPSSGNCVHECFELRVRETPDAPAVVFRDDVLSYAGLNARANRLARTLAGLGVGAGVPVALMLERSPEMIVALLAILKAGGAFVPLDPEYPADRLAFMLEDSGAGILLTRNNLRQRLPHAALQTLCLDDDRRDSTTGADRNLERPVASRDLAYVIYTSGSTGKPKGVAVEQRALARHCHAIRDCFGLTVGDRVFQFASLSFDASLEQILPTLCRGALLVLPEPGLHSPEMLTASLQRYGVTVLELPPAYFRLWSQSEGAQGTRLRLIILGGDAVTPETITAWSGWPAPQPRLLNSYGPTEAVISATWYDIPAALSEGTVPIGRPLPGRTLYVLDRHGQPTPVGVPGELHIGGDGLARGYLNHPHQSAEKFIPDPFSPEAGARLFRTGDLVRYRSDGNLEFLGRLDQQVKIRGFRIEPGEIEAALLAHPALREAVVVPCREAAGEQSLVAYCVARESSAPPAAGELRNTLKNSLPEYMLPAACHFLPALPLTLGGKVDRAALGRLRPAERNPADEAVADDVRPGTERTIAAVWEQILGVKQVGRDDNFFTLGGHSLTALAVLGRLRNGSGYDLNLSDLFAFPTVSGLARCAERREGGSDAGTLAIPRLAEAPCYPLSHGQKRFWLLDQAGSAASSYNMSAAWLLEGALDYTALQRAIQQVADRHESLRSSFELRAGRPAQIVHARLDAIFRVLDLRAENRPEQRALELARQEGDAVFDLAVAPLMRTLLLELPDGPGGEARAVLSVVMHHIISDGWSVGILLREIARLYAGEGPEELPPLPVRYRDYASWYNRQAAADAGNAALAYWLGELDGAAVSPELPTDFPRPERPTYRGGRVPLRPGSAVAQGVRRLAAVQETTPFTLLLAAIAILLHSRSGRSDIVIGVPVAGRGHPDLDHQIGLFLNTLALRCRITPDRSFVLFLQQVKQTVEGGFRHQEYPFDLIVERLGVRPEPGRTPLFDVLFVLQNTEPAVLSLNGVAVSPLFEGGGGSKCDLMFDLADNAELSGVIEYSADLYRHETALRYGEDLQKILARVAVEPSVTVAELARMLVPAGDSASRRLSEQAMAALSEEF